MAAEKAAAASKEAKKTTTAKTTKRAVKKEPKRKFCVQWLGNSYSQDDIEKLVKKSWTKEYKKKAGDIKNIEIYVKVEENTAYYVINGTDDGKVSLLAE